MADAAALAALERRLDEDFPPTGEAAHYRLERIPLPDDEMIEVGGLGAGLLALMVVAKLFKGKLVRAQRAYASSLVMSLILFAAGGVLGLMISGQK